VTGSRRIIGVDESGKGDFFGPLVVAAFLCDDSEKTHLEELGVRDGKLIAEKKLLRIAEQLRANYEHTVIIINPEEYNLTYDKIKNLNKLLANSHAQAIDVVAQNHKADLAISDKFGKSELVEMALYRLGQKIDIHQMVRGERIIQVAAASILARASFISRMYKLSKEYKMEVPRGASAQVDKAGREIVGRYGVEVLRKLAKLHFKNYYRVVNPSLF